MARKGKKATDRTGFRNAMVLPYRCAQGFESGHLNIIREESYM